MRARTLGIVLDTVSLGLVCLIVAVLASEMPISWRIIGTSMLLLGGLALIIGWGQYRRTTHRQAGDCRYLAMTQRIGLASRDPWPHTPQLLERHVFGGQSIKE